MQSFWENPRNLSVQKDVNSLQMTKIAPYQRVHLNQKPGTVERKNKFMSTEMQHPTGANFVTLDVRQQYYPRNLSAILPSQRLAKILKVFLRPELICIT